MNKKNVSFLDLHVFSRLFNSKSISLFFDFGSLYTRVASLEKTLINQPTCYVREKNTGIIVTIGKKALENSGKSAGDAQVIFPIYKGGIVNLHDFEKYLEILLTQIKTQLSSNFFTKINATCFVASSLTPLDKKLFIEAFQKNGITKVKIEEKAKAVLRGWTNTQKKGTMQINPSLDRGFMAILDIGNQLSELVIGSSGEIIFNTTINFGGDQITKAIIEYLKIHHEIQVSYSQAISIKHQMPNIIDNKGKNPFGEKMNKPAINEENIGKINENSIINIRGVELSEGLVVTKKIQVESIRMIILEQLAMLSKSLKKSLIKMNSQQLVSALENGLVLTGGGSLLMGIDDYLSEEMGLCVYKSPDPYNISGL